MSIRQKIGIISFLFLFILLPIEVYVHPVIALAPSPTFPITLVNSYFARCSVGDFHDCNCCLTNGPIQFTNFTNGGNLILISVQILEACPDSPRATDAVKWATVGNVNMTLIRADGINSCGIGGSSFAGNRQEIWSLVNPSTSQFQITVTFNATNPPNNHNEALFVELMVFKNFGSFGSNVGKSVNNNTALGTNNVVTTPSITQSVPASLFLSTFSANGGCTPVTINDFGTTNPTSMIKLIGPGLPDPTNIGVQGNWFSIQPEQPGSYTFSVTFSCTSVDPASSVIEMQGKLAPLPTEPQAVIFADEFLQKGNNALDSGWTIDQYLGTNSTTANVQFPPLIYSTNGYMILKSGSPPIGNPVVTHYSSLPASPSLDYLNNFTGIISRKLTVSAIPFSNNNITNGAYLKIGFAPLIQTPNRYPMIGAAIPYNTPDYNPNDSCTYLSLARDNKAIEYFRFQNNGTVSAYVCGPSGIQSFRFPRNLNPNVYTVFTIKWSAYNFAIYGGMFTSWVYFRVYQEDIRNNVLTDQNFNFTSNVNPIQVQTYVFAAMQDYAGYKGYASINIVHLQNYGSPVDLRVPLKIIPATPSTSTVIGLFAQACLWAGFGNVYVGGIMIYMSTLFVLAVPIVKVTGSTYPAIVIGIMDTALFVYSGVFPFYPVILILIGVSIIGVLIVMRIFAGGGSSESSGDSQDTVISGGLG